MRRFDVCRFAVCLLTVAACLPGGFARAQEEPDPAVIEMVAELIGEQDRDMRALGLQQVREELPGAAATKQFAALLPKLPPESQSGLLEALGDRGDRAALPAVLKMLKSDRAAVRASALKALGPLGGVAEVPVLAGHAASGSEAEQKAARASLARLRGEGINAAIAAAVASSEPAMRVELLGALASRNAREAVPRVLESTRDAEESVRLAALGALRYLATEAETAALVETVRSGQTEAEMRKAELALLSLCSRARRKSLDALIAGLDGAGAPARAILLRGIARCGGDKALEAVAARLKDEDESVRDEAARLLSAWPDSAVLPHLSALASQRQDLRHHVLALRGMVRLAGPQGDKPADAARLAEAMKLASRPEEKRLVLGASGGAASAEALSLAVAALDDPAVVEEAGLAAVLIAEKMKGGDKQVLTAALEKVTEKVENETTRARAQKMLESL